MTYLASAFLYPCVLAALCVGAGLLVDRAAGGVLSAALLLSVGAAALIGLSQLVTLVPALAPATPFVLLGAALAGAALAPGRLRELANAARRRPLLAAGPVLCYAIALAPVLASGRATFSSFMALADSAVHIMGADYLIQHGQSYAHLDLHSSYGQFINDYYNTSYPSGADTLFGGSAKLLGLSLMWTFQPFNAFMLATAFGPAWLLARRLALSARLAWLAALSAVVPALVYGYELLGSVKEIVGLAMMLSAGALVATHRRWLTGSPRGAIPIALVLAAGTSALGIAFGVWALVAVVVLAVALAAQVRAGGVRPGRALATVALAGAVGVVAALPTIVDLGGSLQVASNIASTANPGNLHSPLRAVQVLGVWLSDSYKLRPGGSSGTLTDVLAVLAAGSALLGAVQLLRVRAYALAGWMALTLLAWLIVSRSVTTWASAKTLLLTSPVVMLLVWGGVAALAGERRRGVRALLGRPGIALAGVLAAALLAGVLVSDEMQYRSSNLAPTVRYEQLAALDARFAGRGPALFTDFDEYAMYELRDLDVGGPDFVYPPPALAGLAGGYGDPVVLSRASAGALERYPLIVTRRDPLLARPPSAYALAAENDFYEVWRRLAGAPAPSASFALAGSAAAQCRAIGEIVHHGDAGSSLGRLGAARLVAARAPAVVNVALARTSHPARWGRERRGLVMSVPGSLHATFAVPTAGVWRVWLQGQFMPRIALSVDGRPLASVSGELSGNSLVPDTVPPRVLSLSAGAHTLTLSRSAPGLHPGGRGSAVLDAVFLTPRSEPVAAPLADVPLARWRALCGQRYQWLEAVRA